MHLGFASATALTTAMVPTMISVLQQIPVTSGGAALNLVGMTMLLQFVVNFGFILPVNSPQNMVAYGTDTFSENDFIKTGLVLTAVGYALVLLLGATYGPWMGYMTR
jgi:solute carrier family 13 (sodium-dependent dicarboxylate transporter), member 2/3/5